VAPRTGMEFLDEESNRSRPYRLWNLGSSSPWPSLCTDYDIPAGKSDDQKFKKIIKTAGNLSLLGPNSLPDTRNCVQTGRHPAVSSRSDSSSLVLCKNKINNTVIFLRSPVKWTRNFAISWNENKPRRHCLTSNRT
jgi:hypothetical protein